MNFELFLKGQKFKIFTLKRVEKYIDAIKDKKVKQRIIQYLVRLGDRIPNKPEQWERIKACKRVKAFELKPRPYRLGCYVFEDAILVVHVWRVQKNRSVDKDREIKKVCEVVEEVKDEFERFVRGV